MAAALERASALWARACEFCYGAESLIRHQEQGFLTSSLLLLGYAAELIAKKRLLEVGVGEKDLRSDPYGHKLLDMWKQDVELWNEAEGLYSESSDDDKFAKHMEFLDYHCGRASDYSMRYNSARKIYPDPARLAPVFKEILRRERMRTQEFAASK